MKLITERTQVRAFAAMFNERYKKEPLRALDPETATAAEVAAIMGNDSWCKPSKCHECGEAVEVVVQVGEEPDYESYTANLCFPCVKKAMALFVAN